LNLSSDFLVSKFAFKRTLYRYRAGQAAVDGEEEEEEEEWDDDDERWLTLEDDEEQESTAPLLLSMRRTSGGRDFADEEEDDEDAALASDIEARYRRGQAQGAVEFDMGEDDGVYLDGGEELGAHGGKERGIPIEMRCFDTAGLSTS
jgi:hypothetical protein